MQNKTHLLLVPPEMGWVKYEFFREGGSIPLNRSISGSPKCRYYNKQPSCIQIAQFVSRQLGHSGHNMNLSGSISILPTWYCLRKKRFKAGVYGSYCLTMLYDVAQCAQYFLPNRQCNHDQREGEIQFLNFDLLLSVLPAKPHHIYHHISIKAHIVYDIIISKSCSQRATITYRQAVMVFQRPILKLLYFSLFYLPVCWFPFNYCSVIIGSFPVLTKPQNYCSSLQINIQM